MKFELGKQVELMSGELGQVVGRAEYLASETTYLVRYVAANGCMTESWWSESAIVGKV